MQRFRSLHEAPSNWRILFNTAYCLLLIMVQQVYFFGLYSQALRYQMGYSAFGNQYVYSFALIGYALAMVLTGPLIEYGGIPLALATACITSSAGFSIAALAVGKVRGSISGISSSFEDFASILYAQIWGTFFADDLSDYSSESMKLESFFWFLAALYGCVYGIGAMVVKIWHVVDPHFDRVTEEDELVKNLVTNTETVGTGVTAHPPLRSSLRELLCPGFVALLLIYINYKGIVANYKGDIGKIGESLGLDNTVPNQVMIYGAVSAVTRLIVGVAMDSFQKIPRWAWIEMMAGMQTLVCLANIFFLYTLFQTYLLTILLATSAAIPVTMVAVIGTRFGTANLANVWSITIISSNAGLFVYGAWNSVIYQNRMEPGGFVYKGTQCFELAFVVAAVISAVIMTFFFIFREDATIPLKLRRKREKTSINVGSVQVVA